MSEVLEPNLSFRKRVLGWGLVCVALAVTGLLAALQRLQSISLLIEQGGGDINLVCNEAISLFHWMTGLTIEAPLICLAFAFGLMPLAIASLRERRWPPVGMRVIRRTKVVHTRAIAILLLVLLTLLALVAVGLFAIETHLLGQLYRCIARGCPISVSPMLAALHVLPAILFYVVIRKTTRLSK